MNEQVKQKVETEQRLAVIPASSIVPQSFKELQEFAKIISETDMIPNGYKKKPGDCLVAMIMGSELGLPYLQALQNIATINGKPSIYGDLALALVRSRGDLLEEFDEYDQGEAFKQQSGKCTVKRKGDKKETSFTFSVEDAKRAGLWSKQGPWTQYPGRMLQMRARAFALRDKFPDVLKGISIAEEVQDIIETTAVHINPTTTTQAAPLNQGSDKKDTPAESAAQPATSYLIDKVSKSAHPGLFYVVINGVRYSCSDEAVAKGAFELCEMNKKTEDKKRIDFVSESKDGAQFLVSYTVVTAASQEAKKEAALV